MENNKIYISADMEGITGVINWDETSGNNPDYQYFRKIMTNEVNAAIEGALEQGATDIVVRDAHGSARNLIPDQLHEKSQLIREWSKGPFAMLEGLDESFDAVCCVGYHAKAMTPDGTLAHTMSGSVFDQRVNNISLPELGWNALIAGYHNVPVIFVSGDRAICDQAEKLIPGIETVAVKQGLGEASLNLHPKKSQQLIKEGVIRALGKSSEMKPLKYDPPFTIEVDFKKKEVANRAAWYPGTQRKGDFTVILKSDDFLDCMRFFHLGF
jgi:D-amino peptidase